MEVTNERILSDFRRHGLRATPQRMSVYRYLLEHPVHPSAEEIYRHVRRTYPNFSKTTIYNSLSALVENHLAIQVKIGENEMRYDGNLAFHGHFKCEVCGRIFDFYPHEVEAQDLDGFVVSQKDVYYTGVCRDCNTHS